MRWPWQKTPERSAEAQEHLQRLIERDPEVKKIGQELRAAQRRNHFSDMVNAAIVRGVTKEDH